MNSKKRYVLVTVPSAALTAVFLWWLYRDVRKWFG